MANGFAGRGNKPNREARVKNIEFTEQYLKILFEGGTQLFFDCYNEMDYSWIMYEKPMPGEGWNAVCEEGKINVNEEI